MSTAPDKILWISCVGEKGGAEVYMLNLLRHLDHAKHVAGVALLRSGPLADDLRALGVRVHEFSMHRMRQVDQVALTIVRLARLIREQGYALVHSNGFRAHVYGGLAAKLAGVPEVWTTHTVERACLSTTLIEMIPTKRVMANCPRTAAYFIGHGFPTAMIWPSVDVECLAQQTARAELARRYNIPEAARWVVVGARLQRYKGHQYFLRALAALPETLREVHGVIVGGSLFGMEADLVAELKAEAQRLGIAERVHFTGFVPDEDLHGFLAAAELLVHPALEEDFGLTVAEAQALGRPVLAFASSGPAEIVLPGQTGELVPVGDQAALSTRLAALLAAPEKLRAMGECALRLNDRFAARTAAAQQGRIYTACLADGQRAGMLEVPAS